MSRPKKRKLTIKSFYRKTGSEINTIKQSDSEIEIAKISSLLENAYSVEEIRRAYTVNGRNIEKCIDAMIGSANRKIDPSKPPQDTSDNNAFDNLKQAVPGRLPITILRPEEVTGVIPCVYVDNFLPCDLASKLLDHLIEESHSWVPQPAIVFGKSYFSHHTMCLYSSRNVDYHYQGAQTIPRVMTSQMQLAADLIQSEVNKVYKTRPKLPCEPNEWNPDLVVANLYADGNEHVGPHSDKLTYIGPRPIIASLTLGAGRTFRIIRNQTASAPPQTYDVLLKHNSLFIMFPPCQVNQLNTGGVQTRGSEIGDKNQWLWKTYYTSDMWRHEV
jgi:alkylated DNA repair dioxygenase AlkB